jgi:hypothetical protein
VTGLYRLRLRCRVAEWLFEFSNRNTTGRQCRTLSAERAWATEAEITSPPPVEWLRESAEN